jgi:hypothetical protein
VVFFEPAANDMGTPSEPGKPGKRLIFLNTKLTDTEQAGLATLHRALEEETRVTKSGDSAFPLYARLHALRILQQAKFDKEKALDIMMTHLNMRVKCFPIAEIDVLADLRKGLMYWHGRDRKGRPCLVWPLQRMDGFTKERAIKLVLFVLEYAIRFALVPGRVENWILIVDLENVGLGHSNSANRAIAKNIGILLEQVYCGRNFRTYIVSLPWVLKSIVNTFIPAEKKDKVKFIGKEECAAELGTLFEPHQLEKNFGGTAPNMTPEETYPFRFFPNCTGSPSVSSDASLHMFTDRQFHEGALWDDKSAENWRENMQGQSLTPAAVKELEGMGVKNLKACKDMQRWLELVNPEEAQKRGQQN